MVLFRAGYQESFFGQAFRAVLEKEFSETKDAPAILCIGSNRDILDCFGPLTGTMLSAMIPSLTILGTLDEPIHAKNLVSSLPVINEVSSKKSVIAIDAAIGNPDDIGIIQLKRGSLAPGKALSKRLPLIGDYALTAVVDSNFVQVPSVAEFFYKMLGNWKVNKNHPHSLAPVYHMAGIVSVTLAEWLNSKYPVQ